MSETSSELGNTEYVWINFLGYRSFRRSNRNEPMPDPVPPAIECNSMKPWRDDIQYAMVGFCYKKAHTDLQGVAAICFPVNHIHDLFRYFFSLCVSLSPDISSATSVVRHKDIFWIIKVCKSWRSNIINNLRRGERRSRAVIWHVISWLYRCKQRKSREGGMFRLLLVPSPTRLHGECNDHRRPKH